MDMGIGLAYGAEGAADALRQIIKDRLQQQQQAFENNRLTANDKMNADLHAEQMRSIQENRVASQQKMAEDEAAKGVSGLSIGQSIPAPMVGRLRGTMQAANIADNPPLAQPPNMPDMMQPDIVPGMQPGAVWKGNDQQRTDDEKKQIVGRLISSLPAGSRERNALEYEQGTGRNAPAGMFDKPTKPGQLIQDAQGNYQRIGDDNSVTPVGVKGYHPPEHDPASSYQLQPEVDANGKQTGRFLGYNTKTNSWEPVKGTGPGATKAAPGAAQAAQLSAKENDAIAKLDIVDKSIDNAKDLIGPGAGRVATFQQMLGNPDPRISDLKTKLLTIKDKVAGALTASNRQPNPTVLKRFDELLGTQLTPESLKAATAALREMLRPEGSTAGGPSSNDPLGIR